MIATDNMLVAGVVVALLGLVVAVAGTGYLAWVAVVGALCVAVIYDGWRVRSRPEPTVDRRVAHSLALGVETDVDLEIGVGDDRGGRIDLYDGVPPELGARNPAVEARLQPGHRGRASYTVEPVRRGRYTFEPAHVRQYGPLRLVARQIRVGDPEQVRVVPNFRAVSQFALMAVADKKNEIGVREVRRRGEGMEFDCLREYRQGDQLRQIDWNATARHRRVIARQYEDERNQQIVLLLDCGRRMRATDGELSHFDHALNAGLLLSYVALRQGDVVSVGTFGGVDRWIGRQRGPGAVGRIVDGTFDLETTTRPSDFTRAAERVAARQQRRSLVVVLTNLYDAEPRELERALSVLGRRHLVLVASLREEAVEQLAEARIRDFDDALQVAATHHFLKQRREVHARLDESGGLLLDTTPSDLSVDLVNRYLEVKKAGEL